MVVDSSAVLEVLGEAGAANGDSSGLGAAGAAGEFLPDEIYELSQAEIAEVRAPLLWLCCGFVVACCCFDCCFVAALLRLCCCFVCCFVAALLRLCCVFFVAGLMRG